MENEFVNPNGQIGRPATTKEKRSSNFWLIVVAALFIIVPFLAWYFTWFGRNLSDADIATYLSEENNPRHIQHALLQLEQRMERGDPTVKKFYPQIVASTKSQTAEVRKTAAWVLGQDNKSEEFHRALLDLLSDADPLVRRNAALQLVRFGDASGRPELRAMLQSFEVKAPFAGTMVSLLPQGSNVHSGALLGRIRDTSNIVQEFRSPLDGQIARLAVKEGDFVTSGQAIGLMNPDQATVQDALRALVYVGIKDDLPLVQSYVQAGANSQTAQQAIATTKAIEGRRGSP
jgi:biotin carboxyl carrier protein